MVTKCYIIVYLKCFHAKAFQLWEKKNTVRIPVQYNSGRFCPRSASVPSPLCISIIVFLGCPSFSSTLQRQEKRDWILPIELFFCNLLGNDFFSYVYDKDTGTAFDPNTSSEPLKYNHEQWENNYQDMTRNVEDEPIPQQQRDPTTRTPVKHHAAQKLAFYCPKSTISAPKYISVYQYHCVPWPCSFSRGNQS